MRGKWIGTLQPRRSFGGLQRRPCDEYVGNAALMLSESGRGENIIGDTDVSNDMWSAVAVDLVAWPRGKAVTNCRVACT